MQTVDMGWDGPTRRCRSLRRRAKSRLGLRSVEDALFGTATFIQRADSSLRLNVHFHCLVLDEQRLCALIPALPYAAVSRRARDPRPN